MNNYFEATSLQEEISLLISLQQEGGYWDFKKEWHKNKGDLLHDIICMANNLQNHDAYIIVGIDQQNNFLPSDLSTDENRKNTQMLVDFLKDKKFAGGIRPIVYVQTLHYLSKEIDVIVIKKSNNTPFFLTQRFDKVNANNIYTRVSDTNTPVDMTADINNIEYLWKKRFHLDETPLDRINYYISNYNDWLDSAEHGEFSQFYKFSPEYTIDTEKDDTRDGYEFYMFGQTDHIPHWYYVTLRYHHVAMERSLGLALDGGRCFVVIPEREYLSFEKEYHVDAQYAYFIKGSLRHNTLLFFIKRDNHESCYQYTSFLSSIIIFNSIEEKNSFDSYFKTNKKRYRELVDSFDMSRLPIFPRLKNYIMTEFQKDYISSVVAKDMLAEFRISLISDKYVKVTNK